MLEINRQTIVWHILATIGHSIEHKAHILILGVNLRVVLTILHKTCCRDIRVGIIAHTETIDLEIKLRIDIVQRHCLGTTLEVDTRIEAVKQTYVEKSSQVEMRAFDVTIERQTIIWFRQRHIG